MTAGSILSSGSSLRPASTASNVTSSTRSPRSSSSSVGSIRWDEDGLRGVKEIQRRERNEAKANREKDGRENRHSAEGRRRAAIADIFPEVQSSSPSNSEKSLLEPPLVRVEEASWEGVEGVPYRL